MPVGAREQAESKNACFIIIPRTGVCGKVGRASHAFLHLRQILLESTITENDTFSEDFSCADPSNYPSICNNSKKISFPDLPTLSRAIETSSSGSLVSQMSKRHECLATSLVADAQGIPVIHLISI